MSDKVIGSSGNDSMKHLFRDISGNGTQFAMAVVDEARLSSAFTHTSFSNASLANLVTAVNSYLAGSTKRHVDTKYFTDGLVSLTFFAITIEVSG